MLNVTGQERVALLGDPPCTATARAVKLESEVVDGSLGGTPGPMIGQDKSHVLPGIDESGRSPGKLIRS